MLASHRFTRGFLVLMLVLILMLASYVETRLKYKFASLALLRDYSNSFNFYNVAKLSRNKTDGNGV